jgi:hypothetical protein
MRAQGQQQATAHAAGLAGDPPIRRRTALLIVAETSRQRAGEGLLRTAFSMALTCGVAGSGAVWGAVLPHKTWGWGAS